MNLASIIAANESLSVKPKNSDGAFEIAATLNAIAEPPFYIWRSVVPTMQIAENIADWSFLDDMDVGRTALWQMIVRQDYVDVSKPGIRAALMKIIKGNQDIAAALRPVMVRPATVLEEITATGVGTMAEPGTAAFVGVVTPNDVEKARQ